MSVKVSVIIPSFNPGKCIGRCISSLRKQTLKNIEILCVDAGSDDGTCELISEIAEKDSRVKLIVKHGASYGELANSGIEEAAGRFVAFIRPGDLADEDMLQTLYEVSSGMDMVMTGFYNTPGKDEKEVRRDLPPKYTGSKSFNPLLTFDTALDQSEIFSINCAVGSAIISREFLTGRNIYFTEIPGSLYHDVSFSFKVWACASSVRLCQGAPLHCGWKGSSVHGSSGGAVSVFDEYEEIKYFIREVFAEDQDRIRVLSCIAERLKYDSYLSCCRILPEQTRREFIRKASAEFQEDADRGHAIQKYFPSFDWNTFSTWVYDPEEFIIMIERSLKPSLLTRLKKAIKK